MANDLTSEERLAIKSLERLGKRWPKTLLVFGSGGNSISVRKTRDGGYGASCEVASVAGFPNDGGDGGDEFYRGDEF